MTSSFPISAIARIHISKQPLSWRQKIDKNTPYKETKDRIIRIHLIDGSQVNGQVNINRDPQYDRLSDLIASEREPFLILSNVTIYQTDLDNPVKHKTLFVNKTHIIWASPEEDQK